MDGDLDLIRLYAQTRNAEAFSTLVERYQHFVFGVSVRIVGDAAAAEDIAQECFFGLANNAATIRTSVSGWLHRRATNLAISHLRQSHARARREMMYARQKNSEPDDPAWEVVIPALDQALDELPHEERFILVEHFLRRRTQAELAEELRVSRSTVVRRIDSGVESLRTRLKKAGVAVSTALLLMVLTEKLTYAAPASLTVALGKMAMAGVGKAPAAAVTAEAGAGFGLAAKLIAAVAALALLAGGFFAYKLSTQPPGGTDMDIATISRAIMMLLSLTFAPADQQAIQIDVAEPGAAPHALIAKRIADGYDITGDAALACTAQKQPDGTYLATFKQTGLTETVDLRGIAPKEAAAQELSVAGQNVRVTKEADQVKLVAATGESYTLHLTPPAEPLVQVAAAPPAEAVGSDRSDGSDRSAHAAAPATPPQAIDADVTQGALRVQQADGTVVECPLKHTDVQADVSGFIARVKVTQTFFNPFADKIEAVYVFPLPHTSAVDSMTMVIGDRRIIGVIKRRAEAREIYEAALAAGQQTALLEQERPNIFTQSVGNIKPGQEVLIEISYIDVLEYDMGVYTFHFPMVVEPRFSPGSAIGNQAGGQFPDTDRVPDASRINPPILKPPQRNGHDISLALTLDAGVPVTDLKVTNHKADVNQTGKSTASVKLSPADNIPNKDFVLKYKVVGEKPELAVLSHAVEGSGGYFMLMIQPAIDEQLAQAPPRELYFVIDVSGSMRGLPTEKNIEIMHRFFERSKETDTFQVVTFAGNARELFEKPVPMTKENIDKALAFVNLMEGSGGTQMLEGIKKVINAPRDPDRKRIVIMLTDGAIGNEAEIIKEVGEKCGDAIRFWVLGVGNSVNRLLVDGVAKQGGGMGKVVGLKDDPTELVGEIVERIHRAQLANIAINWGDLDVLDTYPAKIPELWAGRPVILFGRYLKGGKATVFVNGTAEGKPLNYPLEVTLPPEQIEHDVLAKVWARKKIEDLSYQSYMSDDPAVVEEITALALDYGLMSQYTSFVAVDTSEKPLPEPATPPRRVMVAVPLPEGVSYEGIFGGEYDQITRESGYQTTGGVKLTMDFGGGSALGLADAPARERERLSRAAGAMGSAAPRLRADYKRMAPMAPATVPGVTGKPILGDLFAAKREQTDAIGIGGLAGHGTISYRAGSLVVVNREAYADALDLESRGAWPAPIREAAPRHHEAAKKALEEAKAQKDKGELPAALTVYQTAYLLETASLSLTGNDDGTAAAAADAVRETRDQIDAALAGHQHPGFARKLDLVIRNCSLEAALKQLEGQGVSIKLLPGSLEDAESLLGYPPHVVYLDLRRATMPQALTWLLEPFHMTYTVQMPEMQSVVVTVGTARRLLDLSVWTYNVGDIASPIQDEMTEADRKDPAKVQAYLDKAYSDFIAAVTWAAGPFQPGVAGQMTNPINPEDSVVMLSPDALMIRGDAKMHERVAKLLAALRDEKGDPNVRGAVEAPIDLAVLQKLTSKRYAARAEALAKQKDALAKLRVLSALDNYSWQLLAAAAGGKLDVEALSYIQWALGDPKDWKMDTPASEALLRRAFWAVSEAAAALPQEKELATLGRTASQFRIIPMEPGPEADLATAYIVLNTKFIDWPVVIQSAPPRTEPLKSMFLSLSREKPKVTADEYVGAMKDKQIAGDDLVLLHALASKRLGGAAWDAFRRSQRDLLGAQPLNGNVVVLINRLGTANLDILGSGPRIVK